jgi:hypothetical protein
MWSKETSNGQVRIPLSYVDLGRNMIKDSVSDESTLRYHNKVSLVISHNPDWIVFLEDHMK